MTVKFSTPIEYSHIIPGVQVRYQGQILRCCQSRHAFENFRTIRKALSILEDMSEELLFGIPEGGTTCIFEDNGGIIESYRSYG